MNYRSFSADTEFEIAPITIFLGANSSGKSAITRLFPLFAQSLAQKSPAPLLWVSDSLDYGSFVDNVTESNSSNTIAFTLKGKANLVAPPFEWRALRSEHSGSRFSFRLNVSGSATETWVSSLELKIFDQLLTFSRNGRSFIQNIELNNAPMNDVLDGRLGLFREGPFPAIMFFRRTDGEFDVVDNDEFLDDAAALLHKYAHKKLALSRIKSSIQNIPALSMSGFFDIVSRRSTPALANRIARISDADRAKIWLFHILSNFNSIMSSIRNSVSSDIVAGGYLGPIRAQASRYYRRQELSIDRIDPSGENLAMYFNSLRDEEREEINADFSQFFGHKINVKPGDGHISLRIVADGNTHDDNLADVGFGFSQLLPVIAQVHAARRSMTGVRPISTSSRPDSPILAVEQPELHLHPAFQAQLGAYFVHAATRGQSGIPPFRFVIETHSEPLVNEVASLVGRAAISADQVRIYLFERGRDGGGTRVVRAEIQPDGSIPNWPFGFFTSGRISRTQKTDDN